MTPTKPSGRLTPEREAACRQHHPPDHAKGGCYACDLLAELDATRERLRVVEGALKELSEAASAVAYWATPRNPADRSERDRLRAALQSQKGGG